MKIGDRAKTTGLTPSRIRYYEAEGLIGAPPRQNNGYRHYPPATALILMLTDRVQKFGFTLEQIRQVLPQGKGTWNHEGFVASLESKGDELRLLQQLRDNQTMILSLITGIENRPEGISCQENMLRIMGLMQVDAPVLHSIQ
ncbi:MerR family transcriptional regulator [Raoultella terrigena]|uniref:MerR family transcriptional regulator n=1 Tax=Raoultella terrigena TaxID=577 RepID=UPI001F51BE15|nr:MerR family transcriptional regulator [Raoultella terrigena]MCI1033773.1 MerR family transcriptional regulator [Raoultella terrigena]